MMKIYTSLKYFLFNLLFMVILPSPLSAEEDKVCPTLGDYIAEGSGLTLEEAAKNCLMCGIYRTIADASIQVVDASWDAFAEPLRGVIVIAASIYIAMYTIKNIVSFSNQDTLAYLSNDKAGIIPLGFKTAVVVLLLSDHTTLYTYLIGPAISAGLDIGQDVAEGIHGIPIDSPRFGNFGDVSDVRSLFNKVIDFVSKFNHSIYSLIALGRLFLCLSFLPDNILESLWFLIPFGAILYIFGWFLLISVSFYLLDVLFRLSVGCILLPLAIACGFSKFTSGYAKQTWDLFVNVFFNFVMLSVLLAFTMQLITNAIAMDFLTGKKLDDLMGVVFDEALANELNDSLHLSAFLYTIICCMISYKLFMQLEQMASSLAGGGGVGKTGQEIGGTLTKMAKTAAGKAIKPAAGITSALAHEAGKTAPAQAVRHPWRTTKRGARAAWNSKAGKATRKFVKNPKKATKSGVRSVRNGIRNASNKVRRTVGAIGRSMINLSRKLRR